MLLLTGEVVRARVLQEPREYALHVCERVCVPTCVRCRARATSTGNGEASKSETTAKRAHIAILDSIVIKRGATVAAETGRCRCIVVVVRRHRFAYSMVFTLRRTRDGISRRATFTTSSLSTSLSLSLSPRTQN